MSGVPQIAAIALIAAVPLVAQANDRPKLDPDDVYKNNCLRCHASTPQYPSGGTQTIVMHMRVRANLTREETDALLEYLAGGTPAASPPARNRQLAQKDDDDFVVAAPALQSPPLLRNPPAEPPLSAPPPRRTPPAASPLRGGSATPRAASAAGAGSAGAASVRESSRALMERGRFPDAARGFADHLRAAPAGTLSVQILITCLPDTVQKAMAHAGSTELYILPVSYRGHDCFRLCWGHYPSAAEAASASRALPDYFRDAGATPRVSRASELLP